VAVSNPPLVGFGLPLKEPKLYDVLLAFRSKLLLDLNCVKIGQIVSFDYPLATINILGQRVLNDGTTSPYPQLENVPVFTLQGGGYSLQLPVAAGDQCLLIFSDRNIDAWNQNGNSQPPLDGRLHDISDGFALVGINWSSDTKLPEPSSTEARLIDPTGLVKVGIENGKITVQNATENLGTILTGITTALQTLNGAVATMTTATIAAGTTQAIASGQIAQIALLLTELAALLY
jgi:Phage protein Gp138 N-terminal domain